MKEILVTNNDFPVGDFIENFLNESDCPVIHIVYSFQEAIETINKKRPDLILLDKNLADPGNCKSSFSALLTKLNIPVIYIERTGKLLNDIEIQKTSHPIHIPTQKGELLCIVSPNIENTNNKNIQIENIIVECGLKAYYFIRDHINVSTSKNLIISTTSRFNLKIFNDRKLNSIVNLKKINDIRYLNKFFETINEILPDSGIYIGCAETKGLRKQRIFKKYPPVLNYIYYSLDFIIKRIFPKLPITKSIYFWLTQGRNRVLSKPEILGRLYSCGFEVISEQFIENLFYFVVRKNRPPFFDNNPTYGPIIQLQRIGKKGKIIHVYKFRTMHPFSEYIQDYIYKENQLASGGKFKDDFRVTTLGRFLRKFWLDEIPMIYNLLKGDIKLFGVRPLSVQYFSIYPDDFRKMRIKYKPGLIPPFYKDLPKTLEEIIESERNYLTQYNKHPFKTDVKYFFHALHNIIFKNIRGN